MKLIVTLGLPLLLMQGYHALGQVRGSSWSTLPSVASSQDPVKKIVPALQVTAPPTLPRTISYQGLLTASGGTPAADGSYNLQFDLFDSSVGGSSQWTESHAAVSVQRGTFNVILGSTTSLNVDFNRSLYLEVKALSGPAGPSYPVTFSPRSALTSAPSALAPWASNGSTIYYGGGRVGVGTSTPGTVFGTARMEIADSNGFNSDFALRVAGGSFGILHLASSRGSLQSPTASFTNDPMGALAFWGHNGSYYGYSAGIYGFIDSVPLGVSIPSRLSFYTSASQGPTEKMRIDRDGTLYLDFSGVNDGGIYPGGIAFGQPTSGEGIASKRTAGGNINGLDLYTNNTARLSITNGGNVGIGNTTPLQKLAVESSTAPVAIFSHSVVNNGSGIIAESDSGSASVGVWGRSFSGFAGYFTGNVHVAGTLSKTAGSFQIDDPLDPANKYLYHSFVESPDMKNIYDGVVTLDADGEATVEFPAWFDALNKDFRYQLTCIGGFAPVYISQEISNNRFKVAGGKPGMKVSWMVTGIRQDPYANAHRIPVEEWKPSSERGKYLFPTLYGLPETMNVEYDRIKTMKSVGENN